MPSAMYAEDDTAKNRCPTDMCGVTQNVTSRPSIIGWRHQAYIHRRASPCSVALVRPKNSAWSTMNVEAATTSQPSAYTTQNTTETGAPTRQTVVGTGCHQPNTANSSRLATSTKVLR